MMTATIDAQQPLIYRHYCPHCEKCLLVRAHGIVDVLRIAAAAEDAHHPCPVAFPEIDPADRVIIPILAAAGYAPGEVITLPSGQAVLGCQLAAWRRPRPLGAA